MVTDLVTTVYLRDFEIDNSVVVGQYPRNEQFAMLFEQGNPLVGCVNQVLGEMKEDGTLRDLEEEYLQQYLSVPTLKDRKSTRLNSSHANISYAVFCLKKKKK